MVRGLLAAGQVQATVIHVYIETKLDKLCHSTLARVPSKKSCHVHVHVHVRVYVHEGRCTLTYFVCRHRIFRFLVCRIQRGGPMDSRGVYN